MSPVRIVLASLLLVASARTGALAADEGASPAGPLPWRDPSPFGRLFLQLPFEAPDVLSPGALGVRLDLLYSNSLLLSQNAAFSLDVHVETAQPMLVVRYGLAPRLEAELGLPFVVNDGGFLDGPIERVEGWFRSANPQRFQVPRADPRFRLTRPDGSGIADDGTGGGLGDLWAGLKVSLPVSLEAVRLALRGAVKLPTGRLPFGSGTVDVGASLLASWSSRLAAVRFELDVVVPTADLPVVHVRTRTYGAAHLGVSWRLGGRFALLTQASGHLSPLRSTGLDQLDLPTAYLLLGLDVALSRSVHLQAGVAENIFSPYRGADITFPFGLRASF